MPRTVELALKGAREAAAEAEAEQLVHGTLELGLTARVVDGEQQVKARGQYAACGAHAHASGAGVIRLLPLERSASHPVQPGM